MRDNYILTAESVTEGHPDKLCDAIADSVLDACLKHDPAARVACEVMATAGKIIVAGEITAAELPDIPAIVCQTVRETGYGSDYEVEIITHDQSGDIAGAVDGSNMGSPRKPSAAGCVGRGGAAQRVSFAACGEARDVELAPTRAPATRASCTAMLVRKRPNCCLCPWCWPTS